MRKIVILSLWGWFLAVALPAQRIQVTGPAAGAVWPLNTSQTVTWTRSGTMDDRVFIRLFRDGEPARYISEDTENDGSFSWTVPNALTQGGYTVRVRTLDGAVTGDSGVFTIGDETEAPPAPNRASLKVLWPDGGESIVYGDGVKIRWTATDVPGAAPVEISLYKGSKELGTLANGLRADSGAFAWPVGKIEPKKLEPGRDYKVRLRISGSSVADASDRPFTIVARSPASAGGDLALKRIWADTDGNVRIAVSSTFPGLEHRLVYEISRPVWAPVRVERKSIDLDFNAPGEKEYVLERVLATDLDMTGNDIIHSDYTVKLDPDNALAETNESNNRVDASLCGHAFFPVIEAVIVGGAEARTRNQTVVVREEAGYCPSDDKAWIETCVVVRNYGYAPHDVMVYIHQIGNLPSPAGSGPGGAPLRHQDRTVFSTSCYMRINSLHNVREGGTEYYLYPTELVAEIVWNGPGARTHMARFSMMADFSQLRRD